MAGLLGELAGDGVTTSQRKGDREAGEWNLGDRELRMGGRVDDLGRESTIHEGEFGRLGD